MLVRDEVMRQLTFRSLFFLALVPAVFPLEFLNAAGGVDKLHLARKERVRGAGDVELHERIFLAIGPFDGFTALDGGAGQKREIGGRVHEHDFPVIGMDILLHHLTLREVIMTGIIAF